MILGHDAWFHDQFLIKIKFRWNLFRLHVWCWHCARIQCRVRAAISFLEWVLEYCLKSKIEIRIPISVFHHRIKISKLNEIYELVSNFVAEKNISKIDVKCIKWRSWCAVVWWVIQIPIASEQPSTTITLDQCTTACRVDHTLFDFFKRRLQNFAESVNLYGWNREMLWVFGKPHIIFHEHRHLAVYAIWLVYTLLPNWRWGPHLPANYFVYIGNDMEEIRFQAFTIFKKLL